MQPTSTKSKWMALLGVLLVTLIVAVCAGRWEGDAATNVSVDKPEVLLGGMTL